jgi:Eukaryotic aspartyl protease
LKRRKFNHPHPLIKRQDQTGDASIIDVRQLKFLAEVSFGDQTFDAILDTGSSDTWLIQTGFVCYDPSSGAQVDESNCEFGATWTPDSSFTQYDNYNIKSSYGDGSRYVAGPLGYVDVTLAGLTVPSQTVGAPNIVSKSPVHLKT